MMLFYTINIFVINRRSFAAAIISNWQTQTSHTNSLISSTAYKLGSNSLVKVDIIVFAHALQ